MLIFRYPSKKAMQAAIGQPLKYIETSMFGEEYTPDGKLVGSNRPYSPEYGYSSERCFDGLKKNGTKKKAKEFFASVTLKDGLIVKVE